MPNEVIELEESICQIQKDIADTQRVLRDNDRETKKWIDKLEVTQNILRLNLKNKKHIRGAAEIVELNEYKRIIEKIEEMQEEERECNLQLSVLRKVAQGLQSSVHLNTTLLSQSMKKLSTYGQVIPLKGDSDAE
jgi:hypothetical protein